MSSADTQSEIEVVYALPDNQHIVSIPWQDGLTVAQAISISGIVAQFPDIEITEGRVGVFGLRQPLNFELSPGDRVEIYRPLEMSPTDARRLRAKQV